jgi:putative N6-adenine-specific DNA methylase
MTARAMCPGAISCAPTCPSGSKPPARESKIYHSGAAAERIVTAIQKTLGAPHVEEAGTVMVRIDHDLCTISLDTSGEGLHKRGYKEAVNRAPMRETMAALFLQQCGFDGSEPVLDPMCGSGTFVIEAAEIAAGSTRPLSPLRLRAARDLRSEGLAADARGEEPAPAGRPLLRQRPRCRRHGHEPRQCRARRRQPTAPSSGRPRSARSSRPPGRRASSSSIRPTATRIGDKTKLAALYRALGQTLTSRFSGWRVGLIASEPCWPARPGCPSCRPMRPVPHGGLRVTLFRTGTLA